MHFAVGMACSGALATGACLVLRKGWKWIPAAMTFGGFWAIVPDLPRLWREDFPSLPFASTLGQKSLEKWLHNWGDVFFFHHWFDSHREGHQYALHGLIGMIFLYNVGIAWLMLLNWKQRSKAKSTPNSGGLRLTSHSDARPDANSDAEGEAFVRRMRSSHLSRTG